jgi:TolA-binding protein
VPSTQPLSAPAAPAAGHTASASAAGATDEAGIIKPVRGKDAARTPDPTAEVIRIATAKVEAKLYDQALADLKSAVGGNPAPAGAANAYLLIGAIYERQQRVDDAMANYVELRSKFGSTPQAAEATFRLAELTLHSKRADREQAAIGLFDEVVKLQPSGTLAPRALVRKAELEDHAKLRAFDAQLGTSVPAALISYRTIVETYPDAASVGSALAKLADLYDDMKRYELAAQTLEQLATRFPASAQDAAWRAGEIYEKRLKNADKAREAYALVPQRSDHYKDAQKKATQR